MAIDALYPFSEYKLYIVFHKKEGRRMACLVKVGGKDRTTISYARYLMSVHLKRKLEPNEHVDHINNDKLDDRIENYQLLTIAQNNLKSSKGRSFVKKICPICGKDFLLEKRQIHPSKSLEPCCSRRCGGIKSHIRTVSKMVNAASS